MSKTQQPRKPTPRQEASAAETSAERLAELAEDPKLARLVAANPNAPADLLQELSHSDDKTVRKACTSNANTPMEALLKLGAQFPEQLLENPVFDLLLLAHPGLFEELPTSTLNSLLKRDQVPVELIRWAWKHRGESTLHSLLMNPNTPADVVEELCKSKDPEVRMVADLHCSRECPKWSTSVTNEEDLLQHKEILAQFSIHDDDDKVLGNIAELIDERDAARLLRYLPETALISIGRHTMRTRLLDLLAENPSGQVRESVAANPSATPSILQQLALDSDADVAEAVASNQQISTDTIRILSKHKSDRARRAIAMNRMVTPEILESLSRDHSENVRTQAAANANTPISALAELANDDSKEVRAKVAVHALIPVDLMQELLNDPEPCVRLSLARNPGLPVEAQLLLAKDGDSDVRLSLLQCQAISVQALALLAVDPDTSIRYILARDLPLPQVVAVILSHDKDPDVREKVTSKYPEAASMLISDPNKYVRAAAASNDKTSPHDLRSLAKDNDPMVRVCVAGNICTPPETLSNLAEDWGYCQEKEMFVAMEIASNPSTPSKALSKLAYDEESMTRCRVSRNPATPADVLVKLSRDTEEAVRICVLDNGHLPLENLQELANDSSDLVRKYANACLSRIRACRSGEGGRNAQPEASATGRDHIEDADTMNMKCIAGGIARLCSATKPSAVRRFLLTLPQCPADILAKNFRSRSWLERFAIAGNPSTPESVLERMANEGNQLVRRAAKANLEAPSRSAVKEPPAAEENA